MEKLLIYLFRVILEKEEKQKCLVNEQVNEKKTLGENPAGRTPGYNLLT